MHFVNQQLVGGWSAQSRATRQILKARPNPGREDQSLAARRTGRFTRRLCSITLLCLLVGLAGAFAQSGGSTILGTLTDQTGAVIANGEVTLTEVNTGAVRRAVSGDAGLFRLLNLLPGRYSAVIRAAGFKSLEIKDISLASSESRDLGGLVLQLGDLTQQVAVTAEATPVQTASSERSAVIDSNQLNDLALKGRDPFGFMRLIPGIVDTAADRSSGASASGIIINGMASNTKNVTFDGVTELDQGGANTLYVGPPIDAIGEMKVMANAFQAEYGRTAGGSINMVTKSGSREFHGTGYWNRRHDSMNANTFFNNRQAVARSRYRYFVPGYSLGGPVYIPRVFNTNKSKLFFFISQEYTRVTPAATVATANLPTAAQRTGDFSGALNSLGKLIPVIDPTTKAQFPGNIVPSDRIDKVGQFYLNFFPLPNGYVNPSPGQQYTSNYINVFSTYNHGLTTILRGDYAVTDRMNVYLRYGLNQNERNSFNVITPGAGEMLMRVPGYSWTVHAVNTITPTLVNELTLGLGQNSFRILRPDTFDLSTVLRSSKTIDPPTLRPFPSGGTLPISGLQAYFPYIPQATFSGGSFPNPGYIYPAVAPGQISAFPYYNYNYTYTAQDDLSKVIGMHSIKGGIYYEYNKKIEPYPGAGSYMGVFNFGSTASNPFDSGTGYSNALLGNFQTYSEASNRVIPDPHNVEIEGYLQDNWRATRRLTLDYGLRWYHIGPTYDVSNSYSEFYPQLWDPSRAARLYRPATVNNQNVALDPVTGKTTYYALQATVVPGSGDPVNGMHVNGLTGKSDYADFPYLLFTPRFGFAWNVFGDDKTVVRGSFGLFYSRPNANYLVIGSAPPLIYTPTLYYSSVKQISEAAASAAISATNASVQYGPQKMERTHQVNITIQRDIGFNTVVDVAYVGNFDRHALTSWQLNSIPEFSYKNPANLFNNTEMSQDLLRTKYPGMGSILYYSGALSALNYHALQMSAQHRLQKGLQFGVSYAFSKTLGTCGSYSGIGQGGQCNIGDPYHNYRQWYYTPLSWDRTHVLNINYSYQLPIQLRNRVAKAVTDNWVLSGITSFQTGAPVTPACSSTDAGPANSDPSLSGVGVWSAQNAIGARCQAVADPKDFQKSFFTNFNTSAFTLASPGTYGNTGLGILRQPSWYNFDVTLQKQIRLGKSERRTLQLRFEGYNVFNHTEFSTIGTTMQLSQGKQINSTYGQYTATMPARVLSTTVRVQF
jgi:hypothetical protein